MQGIRDSGVGDGRGVQGRKNVYKCIEVRGTMECLWNLSNFSIAQGFNAGEWRDEDDER